MVAGWLVWVSSDLWSDGCFMGLRCSRRCHELPGFVDVSTDSRMPRASVVNLIVSRKQLMLDGLIPEAGILLHVIGLKMMARIIKSLPWCTSCRVRHRILCCAKLLFVRVLRTCSFG